MAEPLRVSDPAEAPPRETLRSAGVRWLITLVAIVLWLYALIGPEGIRAQVERRQKRDSLQVLLEREQAKTRAVQQEVRELQENDTAIERVIRGELDYQKPGETVLIVPDPPSPDPASLPPG